ncbi:MAG TPA: four helix bundle protein [Verrucomicrobia bacterium]|jgi:four helix bundle protein|nr:four helix bundle protein [Verrucomicrobiota bacterium]
MKLDHEKLDVYRVALNFAAWAYTVCRTLKGLDRPTRDQLVRASQSIALNIAEGCGKIPAAERGRFLQIACGSARECGAILDILERCGTLDSEAVCTGKDLLVRIVAMLTRMIERGNQVCEQESVYRYEEDEGQQEGVGDLL